MMPIAILSSVRALAFAVLLAVALVPVTRAVAQLQPPAVTWHPGEVVVGLAHVCLYWDSERRLHLVDPQGVDNVLAHVNASDIIIWNVGDQEP